MKERQSPAPLRPGELLFAVLVTGFSALALWQAYEISGFSGLSTPGIFPMLAAATMLISALFILTDAGSRRSAEGPMEASPTRVLSSHLMVVALLVAGYVFAMPYVGFMVCSSVFLFLSFAFLWRRRIWISLLLTAGTLAGIYLVFRMIFQVVLPRGSLLQGWL